MNNKKRTKYTFLFCILLSTAQLPAASLSGLSFALNLANFVQRYSDYLPTIKQHLPKLQKYIPLHKINNHKKSLITAVVILTFTSIWLIHEKRTSKKIRLRRAIESKLELNKTTHFKIFLNHIRTFISKLINKKSWEWLWDLANGRARDLINSKQKYQRELLGDLYHALASTDATGLEILVETPSFIDRFFIDYPDKIIDSNTVKIPLGIGNTIEKQVENGYQNQNINPLNPDRWITPLQYIIQQNFNSELNAEEKLNLINILLSNGANPLMEDHDRNDALHYALSIGNPDINVIKQLLNAGAYPDRPNANGITCLHLVSDIKNNQLREKVAKMLIKNQLYMNARDNNGDKALIYAAKKNRPELVELFLTKTKARIDQLDKFGNSLLSFTMHYIKEQTNPKWNKIANLLFAHPHIKNISDLPKKNGIRPIHLAIMYENDECIKQLIKKNVNINQETTFTFNNKKIKISPIQFACINQYKDAIIIFLENNLIPINFTTTNGDTLAHLVVKNFQENQAIELIEKIKEKCLPLNKENNDDKTVLEIAFEKNYLNLVNYLLTQEDISEDFVFSDGKTILEKIAVLKDQKAEELMKLLLTRLVEEGKLKTAYDDNAFKLALQQGSFAANYFIKSNDTPHNVVFEQNNTPAHIAATLITGNKLIKNLADHNFPLDNPNTNGQRPIEIACARNNQTMLASLINSGKIPPDTQYTGNKSLAHLVMQLDNDDYIQQLLSLLQKNHFPLTERNSEGETILHEAIKQKKQKIITWLIHNCSKLRAIPNINNQLPLHYVARNGDRKLYEQFNPQAEEQDQIDSSGKTPPQLLQENSNFFKRRIHHLRQELKQHTFLFIGP